MLYTKYLWNRGKDVDTAVVSVYSLSPAAVCESTRTSPDNFLRDIMYDHGSKNSRRKQLQNSNDWISTDILLNQGGFSYFVANIDQQSKAKLAVTIQESEYTDKRL